MAMVLAGRHLERQAGAGRRRVPGALVASLCLAAQAPGCKKAPPPPPPPPTVTVATAEAKPVARTEEVLATLDGSTNAEIRPQVTGVVQSVDYGEGTVVDARALMFTLDQRPFVAAFHKAEGDLAAAKAQLGKARADVARFAPLVSERAISRQDLDNARAAESVASANVQSATAALESARLNLEWTQVRSPIRGLAGIAQTRVGNLVNPNAVLATVSALDPIRVTFSLNERQYLQYAPVLERAGGPAQRLELVLANDAPYQRPAVLVIVGRGFDRATDTLPIQALFPNADYVLRPGMFARIRIHGDPAPAVLVPDVAVQQMQGQSHVDVVDAQGRVEMRRVQLGPQMGGAYVIESGVRPGDRVIVEGQQTAQPGMKVQVRQAPGAEPPAGAPTRPGER